MRVTVQETGGVAVLNILGHLDIHSHIVLKKKVRDLIDDGRRKFLIDVSGIQTMDSTGVGTLVALLNTSRSRNGDVRLAGSFNPTVADIFRLCGLQRVFTVYEDIERGIEGFTA